MQLTCPKCQGAMRQYERNGVHIDQCTECRGIFLDRGELERLIDAEASWQAAQSVPVATPAAAPAGYPQQQYQQPSHQRHHDDDYERRQRGQHEYEGHGQHKKKKRSFLEDLFD